MVSRSLSRFVTYASTPESRDQTTLAEHEGARRYPPNFVHGDCVWGADTSSSSMRLVRLDVSGRVASPADESVEGETRGLAQNLPTPESTLHAPRQGNVRRELRDVRPRQIATKT